MGLWSKIKRAINAFVEGEKQQNIVDYDFGFSSSYRPDRNSFSRGNERSIVTAIFNRIAIDCASKKIRHVEVDSKGRYIKEVDSDLNRCLSSAANLDQTGRSLIQDIVQSLLDEGCVAVVPIDYYTISEDGKIEIDSIQSLRVGKIVQWFPNKVRVEVYDETDGRRKQFNVLKTRCAIIENPLYAIVNEPNSTFQRLVTKLNILDAIDKQSGSGKLDLIIQLPYIIKSDARKQQALQRKNDIEDQLSNSKYGIAYTDGTEKITQLNRPVDNNLMNQIEYLTSMVFSQLGVTQGTLDGTADKNALNNYDKRTIEPFLCNISEEFERKFISRHRYEENNERIRFFSDPFKLIPVSEIPEMADKLTRNEIMTSNEIRQILGLTPSDDPKADELRNKNLNPGSEQKNVSIEQKDTNIQEGENQNG